MINLNHILVEHPQETHLTNNVSADHATTFLSGRRHISTITGITPAFLTIQPIHASSQPTRTVIFQDKLLMVSPGVMVNMASTLLFLR